jgi:catechol-2,3-dioxygenase
LPIRGLYEVVIRVSDLARSEAFYRQVLGLDVGLRDVSRKMVFLRAGGQAGMLVLQEDESAKPSQHLAFAVSPSDLADAAAVLASRGIAVQGPVLHTWMPARSVYFSDPDGHDLELCAPLHAPA